MPHIGHFILRRVSGGLDRPTGRIYQASAISARCLTCEKSQTPGPRQPSKQFPVERFSAVLAAVLAKPSATHTSMSS